MKYETLTAKPDSYEKFTRLESKLLKPQFHGGTFFAAMDECHRLHMVYRTPDSKTAEYYRREDSGEITFNYSDAVAWFESGAAVTLWNADGERYRTWTPKKPA